MLRQEADCEVQPVVASAPEPVMRVVPDAPAPQVPAFVDDMREPAPAERLEANPRFDLMPAVERYNRPLGAPQVAAPSRTDRLVASEPVATEAFDAPRARPRNLREFFGIVSRGRTAEPPRAPEPSSHQTAPRVEPQLPTMRPDPAQRVVAPRAQEDQYDIPAFLRRQAN